MKKFLSLVLTLALALSLVTVSAGATDFEDDGDITYQEAIDVIAGLGIVDGYSDGTFGPDEVLTRGAAAKIICNLILGPTTASVLSASSAPFVDVPVTNTFAGYITYCAQQGIINGYSDGTFRPTGTLTGNAFMKMLLGALGYDATIEGYTGANWNVSVLKQAVGIGLNDGNDDFLGSQAVTRQEACLYAFNMLQATMVEYSNSSTVVVGDVTVSTTSTRSDVENSTKTDGNIDDDGLMQFAEKYFDDLVAEDDTDSFGRPATTWDYDGDELGTYANDADGIFVVDGNDDLVTLMTDGDCLNYSSKDILSSAEVYYNGTLEGKYSALSADVLAGKGDILEAYENDDGDVDTIVFRSYTYAQVDEVITDLSSTHENKGASVGIDLVDIDGNSFGTYYDDYNDDDKVLSGYNSSYDEGTVLAIALSDDGAILDSYVMESVTDTPSAAKEVTVYSNDRGDSVVKSGTITIGGTKYDYAAKMTGVGNGENVDFDEEYTVYLTAEGYVLAVDGDSTAALNDVYYVAGAYKSTSSGRSVYYLEAVSVSDGTTYDLKLSDTGKDQFGTPSSYNTAVAGLYVLDEDDDEYFIDADYASASEDYTDGRLADGDEVGSYTVAIGDLSQDVNSDSTTIRFSGSSISRLYLADNTFFVAVEGDAESESISVSTATGVMTVDAEGSTDLTAYAFYKSDDSDAVFVVYAATDLAGAVNISDVVYLTDDADNATSDGYLVDLFFLDTMTLEEDITIDASDDQGFYTYEVDEDGIYELSTKTAFRLGTGEVGDNDDGYAEGVTFTEVRTSHATGSTYTDGETDQGGIDFVAVSFANAEIIDTRSSSDKNSALYGSDIESASALSTAINRGWVEADVFVDDGEIVFVAVVATEDESGSSSGSGSGTDVSGEEIDTGLAGSSAVVTSAKISAAGRLTLKITYTAPDYVAVGDTMTMNIEVYNDGEWWDTLTGINGTVKADGTVSLSYTSSSSGEFDANDELTFEIVDETFNELKVEYEDDKGNDITDLLKSGYTDSLDVTSGGDIVFTLDTLSTAPASISYKVMQGSTVIDSGNLSKTSNWGEQQTISSVTPTLDDEIITVVLDGVDELETVYTLTSSYSGQTVGSSDALTITVEDADTGSGSTVSTIKEGDVIYIFGQLSACSDNYGYEVSVDGISGTTLLTDTTKTLLGSVTVSGDVTIDTSTVEAEPVENITDTTSITWSAVGTITINFARALKTGVTAAANSVNSKAEVDTCTLSSDGKTLTIVMKEGALAANDTLTISGLEDLVYSANTAASATLTLAAGGASTLA